MIEQQRLSAATESWRRLHAVELHQAGWKEHTIAAALDVVPSAVSKWLRKAREGRIDVLRTRWQQTGKRPKLTDEQHRQLLGLLSTGAEEQGGISERWTGTRVAVLIKCEFGVSYHPEYIPRLLRSLGWTPPQPVTIANQRDEQNIEQFKADWNGRTIV